MELAGHHKARLTAVYVVDPYPYLGIGETNPMGFQAYMSAALEHAAQAHAKVMAACERAPTKVDLQLRRAEDVRAAQGIVQMAAQEGADLIVVGSHGRSGISRALLGSVAAQVATLSPVPVLLARMESAA